MKDSQDKTIEFDIDIERFNEGIRLFMASQLKKVWGAAGERLEQFRIYMAIRECEAIETGARKELQDAVLYVQPDDPAENSICIRIELCEEGGHRDEEGNREKCRRRVELEMRNRVKEEPIMDWGNKLTCGADVNVEMVPPIDLTGEFEILWAVCDKAEPKSPISKAVRNVILRLLKSGFRDIDQIRALQYSEHPEEILKKYIGFQDFSFMDNYVDYVVKEYGLPGKEECVKLSLAFYEKRECKGKILLLDEADLCKVRRAKVLIEKRGEKHRKFGDTEYTRKMLEVCWKGNYLVVGSSEEHEILGYVHERKEDSKNTKYKMIEYQGVARWKVRAEGEEILYYKRGAYYLSGGERKRECESRIAKVKEAMLEENAGMKEAKEKQQREIYQSIEAFPIDKCALLIDKLSDSVEHGALVIIAQDAESEVGRLCRKYGRGTKIAQDSFKSRKDFPEDMISGLAAIDGAVFMDFTGKCLAFGVILDGEAKVEGKPDKGARYNSSANYIAEQNRIAVVISEDKEKDIKILYGKRPGEEYR